jgi:hypothetical protein
MDGAKLRLVQPLADTLPPPCSGGRTWTVSVHPPLRAGDPWWCFAVEVDHEQSEELRSVGLSNSETGGTPYEAAREALAAIMPEEAA